MSCVECGKRVGIVWLGITIQFVEPQIFRPTDQEAYLKLHVCKSREPGEEG